MPRSPPTYKPSQPSARKHAPKIADRQARRALNTGSKAWRLIREQVLVRDGYRCQGCGRLVVGREAHVDHIFDDAADPASYVPERLQTLCIWGHARKSFSEERGVKWDGKCERSKGVGEDGWPS